MSSDSFPAMVTVSSGSEMLTAIDITVNGERVTVTLSASDLQRVCTDEQYAMQLWERYRNAGQSTETQIIEAAVVSSYLTTPQLQALQLPAAGLAPLSQYQLVQTATQRGTEDLGPTATSTLFSLQQTYLQPQQQQIPQLVLQPQTAAQNEALPVSGQLGEAEQKTHSLLLESFPLMVVQEPPNAADGPPHAGRKKKARKKGKSGEEKEKKEYKCDQCSAVFIRPNNLRLHQQRHSGERPHVCTVCKASFVEGRNLKRHLVTHKTDRPHVCKECNQTFVEMCNLKRHMRSHQGQRSFVCDECGASFTKSHHLRDHVASHKLGGVHKCDQCESVFSNPNQLRLHIKVHMGGRPYKCPDCSQVFGWYSAYTRHRLVHTEGAEAAVRNKCPKCKASFNRPSHLKRHLQTHTGEKPYDCNECDMKFSQLSHLKRHMQRHLNDRPNRCSECGAAFIEQDKLRRHMRVHLLAEVDVKVESSFVCEQCGARFSMSRHLQNHLRVHRQQIEVNSELLNLEQKMTEKSEKNNSQERTPKKRKKKKMSDRISDTVNDDRDVDEDVTSHDDASDVSNKSVKEDVSSPAPVEAGDAWKDAALKEEIKQDPGDEAHAAKDVEIVPPVKTEPAISTGLAAMRVHPYATRKSTARLKQQQEDAAQQAVTGNGNQPLVVQWQTTKKSGRNSIKHPKPGTANGSRLAASDLPPKGSDDLFVINSVQTAVDGQFSVRETARLASNASVGESPQTSFDNHFVTGDPSHGECDRQVNVSIPCATFDNQFSARQLPLATFDNQLTTSESIHDTFDNHLTASETQATLDNQTNVCEQVFTGLDERFEASASADLANGVTAGEPLLVSGRRHGGRKKFAATEGERVTDNNSTSCGMLYKCKMCDAVFNSHFCLKIHRKTHVDVNICIKCGEALESADSLREHVRDCKGLPSREFEKTKEEETQSKKEQVCTLCGAAFRQFSKLKLHRLLHNCDRPYDCVDCGATFKKTRDLKEHQRAHSGVRPFVCETCGASYTQQSTLLIHMRTHSGFKPHQCKDCGASFSRANRLKIHMRTHTGEKAYTCKQCGESFMWQTTLKSHMAVHSEDYRPLHCDECGVSFTRTSDLDKHMLFHTGQRRYVCKECKKAFSKGVQLQRHLRVHSKAWPFLCHECGAGFGWLSGLVTHRRSHTGERPFICEQCGRAFRMLGHLTRHMAKLHNDDFLLISRIAAPADSSKLKNGEANSYSPVQAKHNETIVDQHGSSSGVDPAKDSEQATIIETNCTSSSSTVPTKSVKHGKTLSKSSSERESAVDQLNHDVARDGSSGCSDTIVQLATQPLMVYDSRSLSAMGLDPGVIFTPVVSSLALDNRCESGATILSHSSTSDIHMGDTVMRVQALDSGRTLHLPPALLATLLHAVIDK